VKTTHSRIVSLGLLVGICYFPAWFWLLCQLTIYGASAPLLNLAFLYLGLHSLWQQRKQIAQLSACWDERVVGHCFILGGVVAFPFLFASVSMQSLLWIFIAAGIAYSTWGLAFFQRHCLSVLMLLFSFYPDWVFLSNKIREFVTPPQFFEKLAAWAGALALQAIGQPAVSQDVYITLSKGSVIVASGCSGFDMAFMIFGTSIALGLFLKQRWSKILGVGAIGIVLALVFNIPRIMLLTLAAVYWGKESFEFWHGAIGGQIFSGLLLTLYYYMAMAFFRQSPVKQK
jgi:exosortase/archaeosortase family protein